MTILIIVGIIVLLGIIFASMYNSLVKLRNNRENAFADIDVQLKQRHDLIPQLVDTVKGYAAHEKETLDRVIQARNGACLLYTSEMGNVRSPFGIRYFSTINAIPCLLK